MEQSNTNKVLGDIQKERISQNEKWGEQNHLPMTWIAIITEELGEAAKEAVDFQCMNKPKVKSDLPFPDIQKQRLVNYRKELVQLAAVATQAIECFDRNVGEGLQ